MATKETLKIFLVDDDAFRTTLYEKFLLNQGFKDVTVYFSGTECLDNLVDEPDIIFLDYQMDDLTGIEVLKKIKRFNPDIHVILLSGQQVLDVAVRSLKYGAFDYIVKDDGEFEKIPEVIEKIVEVRSMLEKRVSGQPPRALSLLGLVLMVSIFCGFLYKMLVL